MRRRRSTKEDERAARRDSGLPGGGRGRIDIVEPIPEKIHIDPYITEGHAGHEESGSSEITPLERLAAGGVRPRTKKATKNPREQ